VEKKDNNEDEGRVKRKEEDLRRDGREKWWKGKGMKWHEGTTTTNERREEKRRGRSRGW